MAKILCLETSQDYCSICIHEDANELYSIVSQEVYSHTSELSVQIQDAFKQVDKHTIDAVAVSIGPGSYTGLRVGVSSAKGLCYGLDIPFIAIPTLQIIAAPYKEEFDLILPSMDARRDEIYTAVYDGQLNCVKDAYCHIIDENTFDTYAIANAMVCGNGSAKVKSKAKRDNHEYVSSSPLAKNMCHLSLEAYLNQNFANTTNVIPIYLKSPNITTQKKNILNVRKT